MHWLVFKALMHLLLFLLISLKYYRYNYSYLYEPLLSLRFAYWQLFVWDLIYCYQLLIIIIIIIIYNIYILFAWFVLEQNTHFFTFIWSNMYAMYYLKHYLPYNCRVVSFSFIQYFIFFIIIFRERWVLFTFPRLLRNTYFIFCSFYVTSDVDQADELYNRSLILLVYLFIYFLFILTSILFRF